MRIGSKRKPFMEPLFDQRKHRLVPCRPSEFLEVHGEHLDVVFLGGYYDVLHVLADGYERTCLDVVETSVLDKILDGFAGTRESLDFVEYDDAVARDERCMIGRTKIHEERVEVVKVLLEVAFHLTRGCREINNKVRGIFVFCKFLGNPALADSPCSVQHGGGLAVAGLFPLKKGVVYLALHYNSFPRTRIL